MDKTSKRFEKSGELIIERLFNAPLHLVWEAHTEPEHLKHWWGPKGFKMEIIRMNFVPGGTLHYSLENEQGFKMWGIVFYKEITEWEKIVFINSFSDEVGEIVRHPMSATFPLKIHNTLTFDTQAEKTLVTLLSKPINATDEEIRTYIGEFDSVRAGFAETFARLDGFLEKQLGSETIRE